MTMLTIEQLLKLTHKDTIKRSIAYKYEPLKHEKIRTRFHEYVGVTLGHGRKHITTVSVTDDETSINSKVVVDCDCDYFKYNLEVPLAARKSAKINRSEARLTSNTNPEFRPGLCVHLVASLKHIIIRPKEE